MTVAELDKMLREFSGMEENWYRIYCENVPPNDPEAKKRYIEYIDKNRLALNTPQLYYNAWNEKDITYETFEEFKKRALEEKRLLSVHAEKEGIKKWLNIQKHGRFSSMYDHYHSFIEMNYMYSGRCTNIVDGKRIEMDTGDVVIMKPGSVHRIVWTGENDILMNIILLPHASATILNKTLVGESDLSAFLVDAVYSQTMTPNHLYLKLSKSPSVSNLLNLLMCEYFDPDQIAAEFMVGSYLQAIFALIWRESVLRPDIAVYYKKPSSILADIIVYIRDNCVTCTRESVAEHFGYSGSRISNILANGVGRGFVQLRNEFRMELAEQYLSSTSLSVRAVAEECGFKNMNQFYKNYKSYFNKLPREQSSNIAKSIS